MQGRQSLRNYFLQLGGSGKAAPHAVLDDDGLDEGLGVVRIAYEALVDHVVAQKLADHLQLVGGGERLSPAGREGRCGEQLEFFPNVLAGSRRLSLSLLLMIEILIVVVKVEIGLDGIVVIIVVFIRQTRTHRHFDTGKENERENYYNASLKQITKSCKGLGMKCIAWKRLWETPKHIAANYCKCMSTCVKMGATTP